MTKCAIVTKVQINFEDDSDLYDILQTINKRKRAYTVKKMLTEYMQIKELIESYKSSNIQNQTGKNIHFAPAKKLNNCFVDDMNFLLNSLVK